MRRSYNFNSKWAFTKEACEIPAEMPRSWCYVNLPHTWNALDGQDGGNDYWRARCLYAKVLTKAELPEAERYYFEVGAANSSADLYINGELIAHHDGGYSRWRVDITEKLKSENLIVIAVDNSKNDSVYPQVADFTFYGGIYRDVRILCTAQTHFDVEWYGGDGVKITPHIVEKNARVDVEVFVKNKADGQKIKYTVFDLSDKEVTSVVSADTTVSLFIDNVHLWHGRRDPYLYKLRVELIFDGESIDSVETHFGCRSFSVDPERGFILNGEEYALRGVSRHQDRDGVGNALIYEHHREDMELIYEIGASAVRLAHYQHSQYFYDLCDKYGIIVWAEIPYISRHMPGGRENTVLQMRELIVQNYNHPSIAFWGLSNEITMGGADDADMIENHRILNDICHEMDQTRLTTVAAVSPCPTDSEYLKIPDLVAYNHYFGWYGGEVDMNGAWFDKFHREHPDIPIGCSEYGAEGLNWHTSEPEQGDYTEEYQAYYHESLIKQLFSRKYLWCTFVWNMFDFGADAREEGGESGQNHKGLVTINRKYKKDAFYAYKAWLSDEPFVHIAGKRYVDRAETVTRVTVYSNQDEVELLVNGKSIGRKRCEDRFFRFDVPLTEKTELVALAGNCTDKGFLRRVEEFNERYRLKEKNAILNWFDVESPDGYYSLKDKISDVMKSEEGRSLMKKILSRIDVGSFSTGNAEMTEMMGSFTLLRLSGMFGMMGVELTKEDLLSINRELNGIKKA